MEADEAKAMSSRAFAPEQAKSMEADEAKAMSSRAFAPEQAKSMEADEVAAQSVPASKLTQPGLTNPIWVKIAYDPEMQSYKVI
jgi:hypothetical protein